MFFFYDYKRMETGTIRIEMIKKYKMYLFFKNDMI